MHSSLAVSAAALCVCVKRVYSALCVCVKRVNSEDFYGDSCSSMGCTMKGFPVKLFKEVTVCFHCRHHGHHQQHHCC